MKNQELFYPTIEARLGSYCFTSGIALEIYSDQKSAYDWAKVKFTKEFQDSVSLNRMDEAELKLGYSNILQTVFSGYVTKSYNHASGADEILLKDEMLKLGETYITNTFLDTVPQEIASYALKQAGITSMKLVSDQYLAKSRVPIVKKSVPELLKHLQDLWNMGELTACIRNKVFYWGVIPPQKRTYQFVYGENIISLGRERGYWELETVSMPDVRHSDMIQVSHPKISGSFEVKKMRFMTSDRGFIRTMICFEG